eukprot:Selendium_serpulae@DN7366_c0_g1_i1.p1
MQQKERTSLLHYVVAHLYTEAIDSCEPPPDDSDSDEPGGRWRSQGSRSRANRSVPPSFRRRGSHHDLDPAARLASLSTELPDVDKVAKIPLSTLLSTLQDIETDETFINGLHASTSTANVKGDPTQKVLGEISKNVRKGIIEYKTVLDESLTSLMNATPSKSAVFRASPFTEAPTNTVATPIPPPHAVTPITAPQRSLA